MAEPRGRLRFELLEEMIRRPWLPAAESLVRHVCRVRAARHRTRRPVPVPAFLGLACLAWRCLPLLALFVVLGVVQRCSFLAWYYLALLGVVDVACLAWHCLALLHVARLAWRR